MSKPKVPIGTAAEVLGYSVAHTRRLDDELRPERRGNGYRAYDLDVLEAFAQRRLAGVSR